MKSRKVYTVKEVCEKYGITRKTLFYYDKTGLVKPTDRVGSQLHKVYNDMSLHRLELVLEYHSAGLKTEEVRKLLSYSSKDFQGQLLCLKEVKKRLSEEYDCKKREIDKLNRMINDLELMETS